MSETLTLLARLAAIVDRTRYEDLPAEVIQAAKWSVLDQVGSALWGVHVGTADAMRRVYEPLGGTAESTVIGRPSKLPALSASYLNSAASPALLDTCRFSTTHPGIVVIPAAIAAAEQRGQSGRQLILAVALGYEVMIRLGAATRVSDRGFVPTTVLGPVGAAAAAAKLAGLDRQATTDALAIASTMGAGLLEAYAAIDSGRNQFGRASQGGLLACLLAAEQMRGNPLMLEGGGFQGTRGFLDAFSAEARISFITDGLASGWGITRVATKIHDGCRYANAAADAALQLARAHAIAPDSVLRIRARTFKLALDVSVRTPTTVSGALFCMEFIIAMALIHGDVFNDRFSLQQLEAPRTRELMAKIDVGLDDALEAAYPGKLGLAMEIDTVDGRTVACQVDFPKGEPENPLSREDRIGKFEHLSRPLLGAHGLQRVIDAVDRLEHLDHIDELTRLCRPMIGKALIAQSA